MVRESGHAGDPVGGQSEEVDPGDPTDPTNRQEVILKRPDTKIRKGLTALLGALLLGLGTAPLVACGDGGSDVDEALEEIEDEAGDAKEEVEDELDDRT